MGYSGVVQAVGHSSVSTAAKTAVIKISKYKVQSELVERLISQFTFVVTITVLSFR